MEQVKQIEELTGVVKRIEERHEDDQKIIENLEGFKTRMMSDLEFYKAKVTTLEALANDHAKQRMTA